MTYFDVAELYNEGRSEEFLGKALKGIPRDRVIVGSKVWPTNMHPASLRKHCEASLTRLDMDYVDIYMLHWPLHPRTYPIFADTTKAGLSGTHDTALDIPLLEDVVDTLLPLQQSGKIRYLAVSNHGVERLQEIQQIGGAYVVNQVIYNLITRAAEMDLFPFCQQAGIGTIAYMVLMQGLLTDKYDTLDEIPDWYARTRHFDSQRTPKTRHGGPGAEPELVQALQEIRALAAECGCTTADLALKWTVANPAITCALVGTQNMTRLKANIAAVEEPLSADVIERLNTITLPLKEKLGPGLDVFESVENDRTR
jgi:aryl-alcohol dehydrogenase-like predicted oxidoreductase